MMMITAMVTASGEERRWVGAERAEVQRRGVGGGSREDQKELEDACHTKPRL